MILRFEIAPSRKEVRLRASTISAPRHSTRPKLPPTKKLTPQPPSRGLGSVSDFTTLYRFCSVSTTRTLTAPSARRCAGCEGRSLRMQMRQALLLGLSFNLYRLKHRRLFLRMSTVPNYLINASTDWAVETYAEQSISRAWTSPTPSGLRSTHCFVPAGGPMGAADLGAIPRRGQRSALDSADGRSLARFAERLSALSDLSSPLSAVAVLRTAAALTPKTRRGLTRPRQDRSKRSVRRCQLQVGEKRGSAVGPTRRGKGGKTMAISDGHDVTCRSYPAAAIP